MHIDAVDYLAFVDITLEGYRRAVARLDDNSVNTTPALDGANSPYAVVTHATSATRWWLLHIIAAEPTNRVRADEFASRGSVDDLIRSLESLHHDLHAAEPALESATRLGNDPGWAPEGLPWTVGRVLMHTYEELAQHLGHLELTVDVVASR